MDHPTSTTIGSYDWINPSAIGSLPPNEDHHPPMIRSAMRPFLIQLRVLKNLLRAIAGEVGHLSLNVYIYKVIICELINLCSFNILFWKKNKQKSSTKNQGSLAMINAQYSPSLLIAASLDLSDLGRHGSFWWCFWWSEIFFCLFLLKRLRNFVKCFVQNDIYV